jgi:hypothetical protein
VGKIDSSRLKNTTAMKKLEEERLHMLNEEQPEIFLPADIDYTLEDALEEIDERNMDIEKGSGIGNDNDEVSFESSYILRKSGNKKHRKYDNNEYCDLEF